MGSPLFADFYSGVISRIVWDEVSGEPSIEELLTAGGSYLSSITPGPDGEIKVLDYYSGRLYRLEPASEGEKSSFPTLLSETGCMNPDDLHTPLRVSPWPPPHGLLLKAPTSQAST